MTFQTTLVIGGCRSGKSRYALKSANAVSGDCKIFLATSVPTDPEMTARVDAHRAQRGDRWHTVEEPVALHTAVASVSKTADVILVDCLTLWTYNLMAGGIRKESGLSAALDPLVAAVTQCPCPVFLVTNEVGYGIVPENDDARCFRDLAGRVNQIMAGAADRVVQVVAGIDVQIKPRGPS